VSRITTHSHPQHPGKILTVHETPTGTTATVVDRSGNETALDITAQDATRQGWRPEFRRDI
jgi:hypothetical protein